MGGRAGQREGGYFAIGIERGKTEANLGTLWRSAVCMGASYVFTIGQRFGRESSDTVHSWQHVPCFSFATFEEFQKFRPYDVPLIGVELTDDAVTLAGFHHPERAMYLLGPEDGNLSKQTQAACQRVVSIPSRWCLNVAVAGSIVLYDRAAKVARLPVDRMVAA